MSCIASIAANTFLEGWRAKTLYGLVAYVAIVVFSITALAPLALGEQSRIAKDFGLAGMEFLGIVLAIVVGTTLVHKEAERRTIYMIVTKPVERFQFLLGKYLGLELLIGVFIMCMAFIFAAGLLALDGTVPAVLAMPVGLIFLKLSVINAMALFFSSVSSPTLGAVFTFCLYLAGSFSRDMLQLFQRVSSQVLKVGISAAYYLLPNLGNLDVKNQVVFGQPVVWPQVWWSLSYTGAYILALLLITAVNFERKDLK